MFAVFFGVLLASAGIEKLVSPIGDSLIARIDALDVTVTGTIAGEGTSAFVVDEVARVRYRLDDTRRAGRYAGHRVRVSGILHKATGTLDVRCIAVIDALPNSALDHQTRAL